MPAFLIIVFGAAIGHAPWIGYVIILAIAGVICFPAFLDQYFGLTKNLPRILIAIALFPSLIFSMAVFISEERDISEEKQATGLETVSKPVNGNATPAVRAAAPTLVDPAMAARNLASSAVQPVKKASPEKLSWSGDYFKNDTSRIVLAVTSNCTAYFVNKKTAGTSKENLAFTDSYIDVPILPGESRKYRPDFKFNGSRDDVDNGLTRCELTDVKYAEFDADLPIHISLSSKKSDHYGDYKATATLTNRSARELFVKKLKLACVIINDRERTDEEYADAIKHGNYQMEGRAYNAYYYDNLIAKPYSSSGETKIVMPAGGSEEVRLYKVGGMFSSDSELGVGDFTKHQCWVPD
ncbi:hypothetical protein [Massilia sp. HP4]|uniref:hypothetical protein n=1 Tax=Massilia sp. HP4 TaxID=2562316 RepID=UPI0010C11B25|nr:hypothetical protein [Massilia sp. HP4]